MKQLLCLILCVTISTFSIAQKKTKAIKGMYFQWGYNKEWYTKSNIHFNTTVNGVPHNFTIYKAKASDKPDFDAIIESPIEISIPQYNYRIGFYLNANKTTALELNFDHTKYVVNDNQLVRAKGTIGGKYFDKDTVFTPNEMHFEHTDGANFYQINFVKQHVLRKVNNRPQFTYLWKLGAGLVIPKTNVTLSGKQIDNRFHVSGYCLGAEAGVRYYPFKKWFIETTAKTGFANYTNAIGIDDGKINHNFGYIELIGTFGYEVSF
jgi:hypothetical protein